MMNAPFKDKVAESTDAPNGRSIGERVAEKTVNGSACTLPSTGLTSIEDRMDVIASCGKKIGVVDHMEGGAIKLTKKDSPDGQHHFIPADWVDRVDHHVHLTKNSMEVERGWQPDSVSCGCSPTV